MSLKIFTAAVTELGGTVEIEGVEFNTNNDWGFGGGYGRDHAGNVKGVDFVLRRGTACFRHLPEEKFSNVRLKAHEHAKFTGELFLKLIREPDATTDSLYTAWEKWRFGSKRRK